MTTAAEMVAQARAVRGRAGMLDRSTRGKLLVRGADRQVFLHNMLSNAITGLLPGQGCRAELLDDRGHIVADLRVYAGADDLLIDTEPGVEDRVRTSLEKYVIMDDVVFEDATAALALVTVSGPESGALLAKLGVAPPPADGAHVRGTLTGIAARIARVRWTGAVDHDVYVERAAGPALIAALRAAGAETVSAETFEALRIEAGVARQGSAELDDVIPLEARLEKEAVSFSKGCYLGQEVLARIDARGHVNRLLVGLLLEGDAAAAPGAHVRAGGKDIGRITSSAIAPTLGRPIALAYVRREQSEPGTNVSVAGISGEIAATVTGLPFVS